MSWLGIDSPVQLNPKWPKPEKDRLLSLSQQFALKKHVWIASSGSSSEPGESVKLMALSEEAMLASADSVNQHLSASEKDIWIQALPVFHVGGLSIEARAYLSNSKVIPGVSTDEKWSPHFYCQQIIKFKATLSSLVPTQVYDLVHANLSAPKSLRAIVVGGSALSQEIHARAIQLGWPLLASYGMTECCSQIATAPLNQGLSLESQLKILSHVKADLTAEGFLKIQSQSLLTGYAQWKNGGPHWTDPKIDQWLITEDLAQLPGGNLVVLGRGMDFVKISGEGVQLSRLQQELENIAQSQLTLSPFDFAIFAIMDARSENKIALAAKNPNSELVKKLVESFNGKVAPYEKIQKVFTVSEIPRTELGKIARKKLAALISAKEN